MSALDVKGKYRYAVASLRNWGDEWQLESSADQESDALTLYTAVTKWEVYQCVALVDSEGPRVLRVHEGEHKTY